MTHYKESDPSSPGLRPGKEIVRLEGVEKAYGAGATAVRALADINLTIAAGELTALCGPSGSGKSTLLNLIGGLDDASKGRVMVADQELGSLSKTALSRLRRDRIGFVFQAFNLIPILTAFENAEFTLALQKCPKAERRERAMAALAAVGLGDYAHRLPGELSGGQQQRVAIARAIAPEPALILADEPTASLDSKSASSLLDLMQELNQSRQMTFVFSTHDQRVLDRARRIVPLVDGRIVSTP